MDILGLRGKEYNDQKYRLEENKNKGLFIMGKWKVTIIVQLYAGHTYMHFSLNVYKVDE